MRAIPALIAAALVASCTAGTTPASDALEGGYFVRDGMVAGIDPPANAIWNLQVEVMDDFGNFDPALMDSGNWATLEDAARKLEAEAQLSAAADYYIVTNPAGGLPPAPEGTDLAAIQARLTANEAGYRSFSTAMAMHAAKLVEAAKAKDAARVTQLANDLQPVCKSCHDVFWYPEE